MQLLTNFEKVGSNPRGVFSDCRDFVFFEGGDRDFGPVFKTGDDAYGVVEDLGVKASPPHQLERHVLAAQASLEAVRVPKERGSLGVFLKI